MSTFCSKCGTENIDNASFCSKCGTGLKAESTLHLNSASVNKIFKTIKTIVIWVIVIIVAIAILEQVSVHNRIESSKIETAELEKGCNNNDAEACYKLGKKLFLDKEILAKGCKLGSKDSCREGKYYKQGCDLKDGESCYQYGMSLSHGDTNYYELACEYGYSKGCMAQ